MDLFPLLHIWLPFIFFLISIQSFEMPLLCSHFYDERLYAATIFMKIYEQEAEPRVPCWKGKAKTSWFW